ncbi:MAG TPA: 30S ribosomal protein S16 [Bacteroidota bacterium]|nr:30S ribosomal protein S16 [Bacteroidota bacterium]
MVRIRLRREGKKQHPIYKIVATDMRAPRNGGYLEALGQYDPHTSPVVITFKEPRVEYWLRNGARPTDTVRSLFKRNGFWLRWTLKRQGKDEATVNTVMERWQTLQVDRPKRDADRKARRLARKKKAAAPAAAPAPADTPAAEAAAS